MLRNKTVQLQLVRLFWCSGPDQNEDNILHPAECGGCGESTTACKGLDLVRPPSPGRSRGPGLGRKPQKRKAWGLVDSLRDISVNEPGDVQPWKTTSNQNPFTVRVYERVGENAKKLPVPKTVEPEDDALGYKAAVLLSETRKPLVLPDYPMDSRFGSLLPMDTSVALEPEAKPPDVNEVPDYHEDIYVYLREMEVQYKLKVGHIKQPDLTDSMRAMLVDWLVMVGQETDLHNETLHLAVNYMDRFLSSSVFQGKLQLLGTAALLLASKFEEIHPPTMAKFLYLTDEVYTKKEVWRMEQLLLKVLNFDLAAPTIHQFLTQYFLHQQPADSRVESLAMFLGELSLIDTDLYQKYLPSTISGAAFHIALYTITGKSWPESLIQKTGYTSESLKPCLSDLHQTFLRAPQQTLQSIQEKYKNEKYQGVSLLNPPETLNL